MRVNRSKIRFKRKKVAFFIDPISIIFTLIFILFFVRFVSDKHLDDVSPNIECENSLLDEADVLYIIPKFENHGISENISWCNYILSLNKTLRMHGVYHTFNEFNESRDFDYVNEGIKEFEKCFGFKPTGFKAPQLEVSQDNLPLLKSLFKVDVKHKVLFHKVYHCSDDKLTPNRIVRII